MSHTIPAIFENGVIRPLEEIELTNGDEVEVILLKKDGATPARAREILSQIASLPLEGNNGELAGAAQDEVLYH